ncbi:lysozyme inhibitor LprI family protein [Jiella sonneratiae]|uniref:DUF1311 domain-containing protein n=1 Tax=Jiella sonneratiae TaxID=2816856 RepID=A0ABS3J099_9HYPH|nr:lysozyme inhibitor LprI family protein [Jiella sonneratiae]MBO0903104.1 DUF1311 domain-containing protein [Jiella sonneratiae]
MRRFTIILVPILLFAHPAVAAGPTVAADAAQLKGCVEEASEGPASCIEAVVTPCVDGLSSPTDQDVVACYERETKAWDALLNANYQASLDDAKSYDADVKANGGDAGAADSLKTAQRAWIAFRDAECDRLYNRNIDGTIRFSVFAVCQNRLTAERAIALRDEAGGEGEGGGN